MESVNQGVDRRGFIQGAGAVAAATVMPTMAAQKKNEATAVDGYAWAEQIRRGDITPLEALEAAIARTEALPKLNAVVIRTTIWHVIRPSRCRLWAALHRAEATARAPMWGVPFLLRI